MRVRVSSGGWFGSNIVLPSHDKAPARSSGGGGTRRGGRGYGGSGGGIWRGKGGRGGGRRVG
eukprot:2174643-Pyramimonas_sp.AAC.1